MPLVFGASLGSLGACVVCLHLRKFRAGVLSYAGAVAALMAVFWGLGLLSDGRVYTPGGTAIALSAEKTITLEPELANGHSEVRFLREPELQEGVIILSVKYLDTDKKNHEPFVFTFNVEKDRFSSGKSAVINHPDLLLCMCRILTRGITGTERI